MSRGGARIGAGRKPSALSVAQERFAGCFVYVVVEIGSQNFKIGISAKPSSRLSGLQNGNPRPLAFAKIWAAESERVARKIEYLAMKELAGMRIGGEWHCGDLAVAIALIGEIANDAASFARATDLAGLENRPVSRMQAAGVLI